MKTELGKFYLNNHVTNINLLKSLAFELLGRSENFRKKICKRFSCFHFKCLFWQIGQLELIN